MMLEPRLIERWRQLPYSGQVLVKSGDWVDEQDTVARVDYIPGAMQRVDAVRPLRIRGAELAEHLLVKVGEPVTRGQLLAASSTFGQRLAVTSPNDGFVGLISHSLGYVYIRQPIPVESNDAIRLNVLKELQLKSNMLARALRVQLGSAVVPEQVVAEGRIGSERSFVLSPVYGRVVDIADGSVVIRPLQVRTEVSAYLSGQVSGVVDGHGAKIRALAHVIVGRYGVGGEAGGPLLMVGAPDRSLTPDDVSADWKDKVIIGGESAEGNTLRLALEAGASALVLAHLPLDTLLEYGGSKLMGFTGNEAISMPIILTEGFLPATMSVATWQCLKGLEGRFASANGTTHIRAGVFRPELVISLRNWATGLHAGGERLPSISVGERVHAIAGPNRGLIGRVLSLPAERQLLATGSLVKVAVVDRPGEPAVIPIGNLEVWQDGQ